MSLAPVRLRVPLGVQVGMVAALFAASLVVLWTTGASVVARERRRSEAKYLLDRAGNELAARGREIIARAGDFPTFPRSSPATSSIASSRPRPPRHSRRIQGHRRGLPRPEVQELPRHRRH